MDNYTRTKLQQIFNTLDGYLGDTDPYFHPDDTDEDIRIEEPVFWAAKEISILLQTTDR